MRRVNRAKKRIGTAVPTLLRQSGTEPVIRVMIESVSEETCVEYANIIADAIIASGHVAE
jgi:phosphoglucosamine mutase